MIFALIHPTNKYSFNPYCEPIKALGVGIGWVLSHSCSAVGPTLTTGPLVYSGAATQSWNLSVANDRNPNPAVKQERVICGLSNC